MGTLDFLFEGSAPASVTRYGSETANIPQWMSDYTQALLGRANAIGAEPYQPYSGPRVAGFAPDTNRAFDMTRNNVGAGQGVLGQGLSALSGAQGRSVADAANPFMTNAQGALAAATNPAGMAPGMGMVMGAGSATYPGAVSEYMNPYIQNVIDRGANLATRTFNEKLMPGIRDMFTANGQFGSSRMAEEVMRGARDTTEGIQMNSNAALADAYQSGSQIFGQDQGRALAAGQGLGSMWDQQADRNLQAGSQYGQLGATAGNLANVDVQNRLDISGRFGDMAETLNRLNISDAAGLEAIGNQQRQLGQQNLDTAFSDFQRQTAYPRDTVDWLSTVIRGLPSSRTGTQTTTGPLPGATYSNSPIEQVGGLAALLRGLQPQGTRTGG